jgi:hypothetical protein
LTKPIRYDYLISWGSIKKKSDHFIYPSNHYVVYFIYIGMINVLLLHITISCHREKGIGYFGDYDMMIYFIYKISSS